MRREEAECSVGMLRMGEERGGRAVRDSAVGLNDEDDHAQGCLGLAWASQRPWIRVFVA